MVRTVLRCDAFLYVARTYFCASASPSFVISCLYSAQVCMAEAWFPASFVIFATGHPRTTFGRLPTDALIILRADATRNTAFAGRPDD